jgi:hypothetical protein
MEDDYEIIKRAFKKYIIKEYNNFEGDPVIKAKIGNVEITFYFSVDEYSDKAHLDNVIAQETDVTEKIRFLRKHPKP